MALFPRLHSSFGPSRHEMGPFLNLFNETFSELQKLSDSTSSAFAPKFDVKEVQDKYILEGELPGISQKDVVLEFADEQTLTIKGRTEHRREEGHKPLDKRTDGNDTTSADETAMTTKDVTTTKGSKEVAKREQQPGHTYWVSERSVGEFARSFAFPNPIDQENVKASMKNGILSITIPKLQRAKTSRRIEISSE